MAQKHIIEKAEFDSKLGKPESRDANMQPCCDCNNSRCGWGMRCSRFKLVVHSLTEGTFYKLQECKDVRARFYEDGKMQCPGFEPKPPPPTGWRKYWRMFAYGE